MRGVSVELPPGGAPRRWGRVQAHGALELPRGIAGQELHREHLTEEGGLRGCLACGHPELYTQKDFPRGLGLAVVILAAALAPFTWYLSLAAATLLDAVLFAAAPSLVICYACGARHRGFLERPRHPRFDHAIAERLRFGERAVMGTPMRAGGTADAPDPEH